MYPTANNIVLMAIKAANQAVGIGYNQTICVWDKNGIVIDIWRKEFNYGLQLRCDGIVSLPVLRCHANQWRPTPDCMDVAGRWLNLVAERRYERLNQQLELY